MIWSRMVGCSMTKAVIGIPILKPANSHSALQPANWPHPVDTMLGSLRARSVSVPGTEQGELRPDGQRSYILPCLPLWRQRPWTVSNQQTNDGARGINFIVYIKLRSEGEYQDRPGALNKQLLLEGIRAKTERLICLYLWNLPMNNEMGGTRSFNCQSRSPQFFCKPISSSQCCNMNHRCTRPSKNMPFGMAFKVTKVN